MPLQLSRVVNSWVRNVSFESVSEAVTFGESANFRLIIFRLRVIADTLLCVHKVPAVCLLAR